MKIETRTDDYNSLEAAYNSWNDLTALQSDKDLGLMAHQILTSFIGVPFMSLDYDEEDKFISTQIMDSYRSSTLILTVHELENEANDYEVEYFIVNEQTFEEEDHDYYQTNDLKSSFQKEILNHWNQKSFNTKA